MSGSGPGAPPVWPKGGERSHCEGGRKGEGGGLASRYIPGTRTCGGVTASPPSPPSSLSPSVSSSGRRCRVRRTPRR
eukprot:5244634-Prymnesium_polylepis.1